MIGVRSRLSFALMVIGGLLMAHVFFAPLVPTAHATSGGIIAGQVLNGTAGGDVAGVALLLRAIKGGTVLQERPHQSDSEGNYRFEGLDLGEGVAYEIAATRGGVTYGAGPIRLTSEVPQQHLVLQIFDTTPIDPGLRVTRSVLIVGGVDQARQELLIMEMVTVENPSDRTFVPQPGGAGGPMNLLRFGLPPGAHSLTPNGGLDAADMIQVDRGFASLAPLLPGERAMSFTYRLPYAGSAIQVEKSFTYGADLFALLTPETGLTIETDWLQETAPAQFGAQRYRVWTARDMERGARFPLGLSDLPAPPLWQPLVRHQAYAPPVLLALALLGGAAWMVRRRLFVQSDPVVTHV